MPPKLNPDEWPPDWQHLIRRINDTLEAQIQAGTPEAGVQIDCRDKHGALVCDAYPSTNDLDDFLEQIRVMSNWADPIHRRSVSYRRPLTGGKEG